ncbi:MAG: hypothetical protein MUP62_04175, partial [Dehalococcoidia bacterium]|nr:hypothetical protein [Dehalococcoidia bacterium]
TGKQLKRKVEHSPRRASPFYHRVAAITSRSMLSEAKNLSGDVRKVASACSEKSERAFPEQSEAMHRHTLETAQASSSPRAGPVFTKPSW